MIHDGTRSIVLVMRCVRRLTNASTLAHVLHSRCHRHFVLAFFVYILKIMSFHRLKLMCSVGGVNVNRDLNQLNSGVPDIMVATPGR